METNILQIKNKILGGYKIQRAEALDLAQEVLRKPELLEPLCQAADEIRLHFCGSRFDLCTIINGKSGSCSEDCRYCAQSSHYPVKTAAYGLLGTQAFLEDAQKNHSKGIHRYSIVTSGRALSQNEVDTICESYIRLEADTVLSLCASHGLLSSSQLRQLKASGVKRYHCNLETSRSFFPKVCTTHTYQDKLNTLRSAKEAGLSVCSGGIVGLGETMEDRLDMAFELRSIGVDSVPLNILNPIPHTPFEHNPVLSLYELRKTAALFRFILPDTVLRLAGGRSLLPDKGESLFRSGINAAISGDMLTTSGIHTEDDIALVKAMGFLVDGGEII